MKIKEKQGKYTRYILSKTDERYGNADKPTTVDIKLASPVENLSRYHVLRSHFFDHESIQRQEIFLTLVDSNILDDEDEPLFKFNNDYSLIAEDFLEVWKERDKFLFDEILECVYTSNPNWAKEWELISEMWKKFYKCLFELSRLAIEVDSFDPEIDMSFEVRTRTKGQISTSVVVPPE